MPAGPLRKSESALIHHLGQELRRATADGGASPGVPFGDDMAGLPAGRAGLLWTVDMLMDGTDFDSSAHAWHAIGRKALAVNLSDVAAMAATPVAALCAVALNDDLTMDDALELSRGIITTGAAFGCPLVGGDTNSWSAPTVVSITVAARMESGLHPVRRDGARPGQTVLVTGRLGGSILGRHMDFEPRIGIAQQIHRRLGPAAMIDISDGLAIDLNRILEASGCGAELDEHLLDAAIHEDARTLSGRDGVPPRAHALHDGEDFELIVVVPASVGPADWEPLGLIPLGRTVERGLWLRLSDGTRSAIEPRGWEHFQ